MSTAMTNVIVEEPQAIPIPPPRLNLQMPPQIQVDTMSSSPPRTPPMRQWPSAPPLPRRSAAPVPSVSITITPESETEEVLIAKMRWLETLACKAVMSEEERRGQLKAVTERFRNTLKMKEFFRRVASSKQMEEDDLYN